ncbi:MAG: hypothetical protein MK135_05075 [Polyangiaceae bacterium]|nr:hypothetical protein [Polyangiaceae bacterium]
MLLRSSLLLSVPFAAFACSQAPKDAPGGGAAGGENEGITRSESEETDSGSLVASESVGLQGIDLAEPNADESKNSPPSSSDYLDPPVTTCSSAQECCDKIEGCQSADQFICTVEGLCGEIRSSCAAAVDCQGDSLCCTYPDCLTEPGDGVCLPGNVAPNTECEEGLKPGVFSPSVQCSWPGDEDVAVASSSVLVMTTPLVANLPHRSGTVDEFSPEGSANEIVVVTTTSNSSTIGVIRIIDGESCELKESIVLEDVASFVTPALADLDADGDIEIVARLSGGGVVAYDWDAETSAYREFWKNTNGVPVSAGLHWSGISIHDLDDQGAPEVLVDMGVYSGEDGEQLAAMNSATILGNGITPTAADLDNDGTVELLAPANGTWTTNLRNWSGSGWSVSTPAHHSAARGTHFAYADFGTQPDDPNADFNPNVLDGIPEVVASGGYGASKVAVSEIKYGKLLMNPSSGIGGGHPNIGDFDGDGIPEIGVAGGNQLKVFDFDCESGCSDEKWVRWKQDSQDGTSRQTSATLFDFDGYGSTEVVYADECYLRVYDGTEGTVLYSAYRNSGTWLEGPLVADVDRDDNTEIVINNNVVVNCDDVDPIHPGILCETDAECPGTSTCADSYCRCGSSADCRGGATLADSGLSCAQAVLPATSDAGNVCRAAHPGANGQQVGIRVLRDRLDRWASSGSIWNQQNFTITNIDDDGKVPKTSEWKANWTEAGLNNYRQNRQGRAGADALPDITGAFRVDDDVCVTSSDSDKIYLQATVCNRGEKGVGSALPATFYDGPKSAGNILCTSYTDGPVPINGCKLVWCEVGSDAAGKEITIEVNDDGNGGRTTIECHSDNNSDSVQVGTCSELVVR